jgi:hypothetical protein
VQLNRIEDPSQRTATILWKAATEGIGIPVTAYYGAKVIPGIISGSTRATASGAATLLSKESIGILPRSAAAIQTAGGAIVAGGIIGGSAVMGYQAAVDLSDKAAFGASTGNYAPFVGTTSVLGGYLAGAVAAGYTTKAAAAREKAGIKPKEMIEGTLELPNGDVYIPKETIPKSPAIKTRIIKGAPAVERYLSQNSDMMDNLNFRRSSFFKENFPKEWAESNGNMAGVTVRNILDGNKARIFINSDMPRGEADVLLRGILSHNDKAINALKNVPSSWTDAIRTEFPFENPYQYSDTGQLMTQKSAIKHEILHVLNPSLDDATQAGIAAMKAMERMPLKIEVPASGYGTLT